MKLLALDTSSDACTVAVAVEDIVVNRHLVEPRAHTRCLIPMLQSAMAEAGVALAELDAIVLGNGPGSFIGIRIGASVAQGMAYGAGVEIAPVSSLAVIAAQVFGTHDVAGVVVAQDARMGEVYLEEYRRGEDGAPVSVAPVRLQKADESFEVAAGAGVALAGGGWSRHPELAGKLRTRIEQVDVLLPDARWLLQLGRSAVAAGTTVAPAALTPEYVRMKVASPS